MNKPSAPMLDTKVRHEALAYDTGSVLNQISGD